MSHVSHQLQVRLGAFVHVILICEAGAVQFVNLDALAFNLLHHLDADVEVVRAHPAVFQSKRLPCHAQVTQQFHRTRGNSHEAGVERIQFLGINTEDFTRLGLGAVQRGHGCVFGILPGNDQVAIQHFASGVGDHGVRIVAHVRIDQVGGQAPFVALGDHRHDAHARAGCIQANHVADLCTAAGAIQGSDGLDVQRAFLLAGVDVQQAIEVLFYPLESFFEQLLVVVTLVCDVNAEEFERSIEFHGYSP